MFEDRGFIPKCFKGGGMGPLLVLVSPCFRENVVVTRKILGLFLCQIIYFRKT